MSDLMEKAMEATEKAGFAGHMRLDVKVCEVLIEVSEQVRKETARDCWEIAKESKEHVPHSMTRCGQADEIADAIKQRYNLKGANNE